MVMRLHQYFRMKEKTVTLPEIALIAGTRVALGAGVGFLLSDKFTKEQRKGAGWALLGIGALTTISLAMEVLGKRPGIGYGFLHGAAA